MREHYEQAAAQGDKGAAMALDLPEIPELFSDVWGGFLELDRARGQSGFGPEPLTYSEIDAWARLTGRGLSSQDVALIIELDRLGFAVRAEGKK